MLNNINIKSDLKKYKIKFIQVQQNDDIILNIKLFENGVPKNLTGSSITINYVNANNTITVISNSLVSIKDNVVTVTCPRNCTRSAGIAKAQLVITSDAKQVSSFSLDLIIIESILMNQEVSKNIANLLEEFQEAINKVDIDLLKVNQLIVTAETKITNLLTQNNAATTNIANLTTQNNEATSHVSDLKNLNTDAANKIIGLTNQNNVANTNLNELEEGLVKGKDLLDELNLYDVGKKANIEEITDINSVTTELKTFYLDTDNSYSCNTSGSETLYRQARFYNKDRNVYHFETDSNEVVIHGIDDKYDNENLTYLLKQLIELLGQKQLATDNNLKTTVKTITGAINEILASKEPKIVAYKTSNGSSWWRKFDDGRLEQGGWIDIVSSSASGACDATITFAVPFVGTKESIRLSANGAPAMYDQNWRGSEAHAISYSTSLTQGRILFLNIDVSIGYTLRCWWEAKGWWK